MSSTQGRQGHHDRHDLDAIAHRVMIDRGLLPDFSGAAQEQARHLTADRGRLQTGGDGPPARDLTGLHWLSFDNDDTRDLDQLSVAEAGPEGSIRIRVAIADVDMAVPLGSPIDDHARHNTTSVYTAARTFPMLPLELSTDLTSLVQDDDRMAMVVDLRVLADGSVAAEREIYRARVRNRSKLAYHAVGAWLQNAGPLPAAAAAVPGIDAQLRLHDEAAGRLRRLRHENGALTLETLEARPVFTADGKLSDLAADPRDRAKELIEDLMIAANTATAQFLDVHGLPSLRRMVRTPKRWPRLVELAAAHGGHLPEEPDAAALEAFLEERRKADPTHFPDVSLAVVKLLGPGEYVVDLPGQPAPGHFGLAVRDYTHATAPNRRYPDLVTQRLLKATLSGRPSPYTTDDLTALARHCTESEDAANKVERQVAKSAAALLLESRLGQQFDAIVTGASEKGTWVRISHPLVEGRVERGAAGLDVGDRVRVRLISTDVERGFIDFAR
jgi:VacB/RNase II family 3'-5' exoribonuclease